MCISDQRFNENPCISECFVHVWELFLFFRHLQSLVLHREPGVGYFISCKHFLSPQISFSEYHNLERHFDYALILKIHFHARLCPFILLYLKYCWHAVDFCVAQSQEWHFDDILILKMHFPVIIVREIIKCSLTVDCWGWYSLTPIQ